MRSRSDRLSASCSSSSVRLRQILIRPDGDDPRRIDVVVRDVVMSLDVVEIDGLGDTVLLVEIAQVAEEVRVIDNPTQVAFEVTVIDSVEPNQRGKQPPVRFR